MVFLELQDSLNGTWKYLITMNLSAQCPSLL